MIVAPSLRCICVSFFFVSMHYNENADLSDGEDDELLPLDTEVGTDDDQENQADAVASVATTTTAASVEEEDRPEFRPHRKLSRGEDLFEFRKEVEMVKEKKFVCSLELHCFLTCLWDAVEQKGVVKSRGQASFCGDHCCCYCQVPSWTHF